MVETLLSLLPAGKLAHVRGLLWHVFSMHYYACIDIMPRQFLTLIQQEVCLVSGKSLC